MATRALTLSNPGKDIYGQSVVMMQWLGLTFATTDDGARAEMVSHADRAVHVTGTPGTGFSLVIEGSNNGATWATLNDFGGAALTFTSLGLRSIRELPRFIRPRVTAGDGTTSVTVTICARSNLR